MSAEKMQLLLVDDEERFRTTLAKRFGEKGVEAMQAGDAMAALALIREHAVDVVVLDIKMPEMDGIEALGEIKKINQSIEVILLTGHAAVDSAVEGMRLGAFDYLLKPCEFEQLLEKVHKAYETKKERDERLRQAEIRSRLDRIEKSWR
ncbi:response regulator [Desulfonatronum thioautotrophicum]|uniref:response regulator n=1 Tax=Desulfonatronum thioautotrophicum TaxID=617001 RepID=UPI0005EBCC13|nr:response regulator [Desulfonatronum thioautotrophicum]